MIKSESKLRSVLKSLSWRCVAIVDTILIVLILSCLFGQCSLEQAFSIAALEFGFKFFVYYLHERIWQRIDVTHRVAKIHTLYKTISWRIVATIMTLIIAGSILGDTNVLALAIALTEVVTKTVFYYIHERLWLTLPLGRIRKLFYERRRSKEHHNS